MAIYSFSAGVFSRSKGHHVTAAAAYRAAELVYDEATGLRFDYSRKHGVVHSETFSLEKVDGHHYNVSISALGRGQLNLSKTYSIAVTI